MKHHTFQVTRLLLHMLLRFFVKLKVQKFQKVGGLVAIHGLEV